MKKLILSIILGLSFISSFAQLPVELSSFNVGTERDFLSINFVSESEVNNDYYTIDVFLNNIFLDSLNVKGENKPHSYEGKIPLGGFGTYDVFLSQKDFDGTISKLERKIVKIRSGDLILRQGLGYISLSLAKDVIFFNDSGLVVYKGVTDYISTEGLITGIYVLNVDGVSKRFFIK